MRIVHLASEFAPFAKAGGLGEVLLGLTRELSKRGQTIETLLPKYDFIDLSFLQDLKKEISGFECFGIKNDLWSCRFEECHLKLLDPLGDKKYFKREKIYGYEDDIERFCYFSRAALEYLSLKKEPIDVLHLHDWHVALAAPLIRNLLVNLTVKSIVLTVHNIEYQGKCSEETIRELGFLKNSEIAFSFLKEGSTFNLLKGGLFFSDAIVPVSPNYAKEVLTSEYGFGLDPVLRKLKGKIQGILNGIDMKSWSPETDPLIPFHYGAESLKKGKQANQALFPTLDRNQRPWIGAVSRLVPQKGPELLEEAIETTLRLGGCFLLLGSSPLPSLQKHFDRLKEKYRHHPQVLLNYHYEDPIAHQMYAALDMVLVPSHFEPCGLTQMIAMLYGAVPIVRETGGLKDTVFDFENPFVPVQKRNGFTFKRTTVQSMNKTLERAFTLFRSDPASFQSLQRRGMKSDFSWKNPAHEYLKLYRNLLKGPFDVAPISIDVVSRRNEGMQSSHGDTKQAHLLE